MRRSSAYLEERICLRWCSPAQHSPGAVVQACSNAIKLGLIVDGDVAVLCRDTAVSDGTAGVVDSRREASQRVMTRHRETDPARVVHRITTSPGPSASDGGHCLPPRAIRTRSFLSNLDESGGMPVKDPQWTRWRAPSAACASRPTSGGSCDDRSVTARRQPWYVVGSSIAPTALVLVASSFLVINSVFFGIDHPPHDRWWFWPLVAITAGSAGMAAASIGWLIKDRSSSRTVQGSGSQDRV